MLCPRASLFLLSIADIFMEWWKKNKCYGTRTVGVCERECFTEIHVSKGTSSSARLIVLLYIYPVFYTQGLFFLLFWVRIGRFIFILWTLIDGFNSLVSQIPIHTRWSKCLLDYVQFGKRNYWFRLLVVFLIKMMGFLIVGGRGGGAVGVWDARAYLLTFGRHCNTFVHSLLFPHISVFLYTMT